MTYANPAARRLFPDLMAAGLGHPLLADLPWRAASESGKDGESSARGTVIFDEVGSSCYRRVVCLLSGGRLARVYLADVTERRRAEEALRKSERRLSRLFEQASDALFVHDLSGNLVDANRRACESLGYSKQELLLGLSVADIEEGFDAAALARLWGRVTREGPVTIEGVHRRRDGSAFPVEVRVGPLEVEGRPLVLALARDAAERKRIEAELWEAKGRYRALVEQMPVATYTQEIDHGGAIAYASPRMEATTGYPSEEWTADLSLWEKTLHPDDRERVLAAKEWIEDPGLWVRIVHPDDRGRFLAETSRAGRRRAVRARVPRGPQGRRALGLGRRPPALFADRNAKGVGPLGEPPMKGAHF